MAIINGMYIHVTDETKEREVQATSHTVEEGAPISDTVNAKALALSLTGKIVDYGNVKAEEVIAKLETWRDSGKLVLYQGRNVASNMQIHSFQQSFNNKNAGGANFTMELKEVRIAKSAYVPKKPAEKEKETVAKKDTSKIEIGSIVLFKGGNVYISSDAKKAACTRGKSTCKVTNINNRSWGIHPYHLISQDGGYVYGWVDKSRVQNNPTTGTSGKTNAGTQQAAKKPVAKSTAANLKAKTNAAKKSGKGFTTKTTQAQK